MAKVRFVPKAGAGYFGDKQRQRRLRLLWSRGYSFAEIAEAFGAPCTRNTVAGAVWRLKLAKRGGQARAA